MGWRLLFICTFYSVQVATVSYFLSNSLSPIVGAELRGRRQLISLRHHSCVWGLLSPSTDAAPSDINSINSISVMLSCQYVDLTWMIWHRDNVVWKNTKLKGASAPWTAAGVPPMFLKKTTKTTQTNKRMTKPHSMIMNIADVLYASLVLKQLVLSGDYVLRWQSITR